MPSLVQDAENLAQHTDILGVTKLTEIVELSYGRRLVRIGIFEKYDSLFAHLMLSHNCNNSQSDHRKLQDCSSTYSPRHKQLLLSLPTVFHLELTNAAIGKN